MVLSEFHFLRCLLTWVILCGALSWGTYEVRAQAPLLRDQVLAPEAGVFIKEQWRLDAAENALLSGLAGTAEGIYRGLLQRADLADEASMDTVRIRLAVSLIAQRRFSSAKEVLDAVPESSRTASYYLYLAVSIYGEGQSVDADAFLAAVSLSSVSGLSSFDLPWYHIMRGLQAEMLGQVDEIFMHFERAEASAVTAQQAVFFESLVMREKMLRSPASEPLALSLRQQWERLQGQATSFPYAREYAIILYNLGRDEQAASVIQQELLAGHGSREREQLQLLLGMIRGSEQRLGRDALMDLIRSGQNADLMGIALQLMTRSPAGYEQELMVFLNEMGERPNHPLLSQIYYARIQLSLAASANTDLEPEVRLRFASAAEDDAVFLLEQFPGFDAIANVYRLLAYAALQRQPPQYRAAADYLIQLRDQAQSVLVRKELNRLIGDCYFLNADYANAVDFYKAARSNEVGLQQGGDLFMRLITAEVRAGQIEEALIHIDEADFTGKISANDRWQAEWNVAQALQAERRTEVALRRVRLLVDGIATSSVNAAIDLRLRWLEAHLSLLNGDTEGVSARVDQLIDRIDSMPSGAASGLSDEEIRLLKAEMLLLKANIFIKEGTSEEGFEILDSLRIGFPQSAAAEQSYMVEAGFHASVGDFEAAQRSLVQLAENYAASELAAQALFEAAVYCEQRGPEHYAEAVRIYNQLAVEYPDNQLVFSTRLRQGDLLRQMNDFAGAQIIYENLINRFPEHPKRYVADLSRADCLLALAKDNPVQLDTVALTFEALMDVPSLPLEFQAEIGYKWGFTLSKRAQQKKAIEVYSLLAGRLLLDEDSADTLGDIGCYWMARTLLGLGELLIEAGETDEALLVYGKVIDYNLPGQNLSRSIINQLSLTAQ